MDNKCEFCLVPCNYSWCSYSRPIVPIDYTTDYPGTEDIAKLSDL